MSNPIIDRPELTGIPRARYYSRPYTNAVPVTFRNSTTMLEQLETLKSYVTTILVPQLDEEMILLVDSWNTAIDQLIDLIVSNSAELQDEVMLAIATNPDSDFAKWVFAQISASIQEKPDDEGVFMIARPPIPAPEPGEIIPDPNNPGFWIEA